MGLAYYEQRSKEVEGDRRKTSVLSLKPWEMKQDMNSREKGSLSQWKVHFNSDCIEREAYHCKNAGVLTKNENSSVGNATLLVELRDSNTPVCLGQSVSDCYRLDMTAITSTLTRFQSVLFVSEWTTLHAVRRSPHIGVSS